MSEADVIPLIIFIVLLAVIAFAGFRIIERRVKSEPELHAAPYPQIRGSRNMARVARQLRDVLGGTFEKQRLLNKSEYRIFKIIEDDLLGARNGYRVFPQVNLGEILQSRSWKAYSAINSKRVDMVIVNAAGWPVAAIEFQGGGHYRGTAEARDAIKEHALQKAGVAYVEIFERESADDICARVRERLGWETPAAEPETAARFGRAQSMLG